MDYILYFVFAGVILVALIIYWIIEFLVAKKIKLKAIEELDRQISEEENLKKIDIEAKQAEFKELTDEQKPKSPKKKSTKKSTIKK